MSQKLTVFLLKDFVESTLDLSGEIASASFDGTNTTFSVCNIFHMRAGMTVEVGANSLVVLSVNQELNEFVVAGDYSTELTFSVPSPFYFWGTPMQAQVELSNTEPAVKYPFIYLKEIVRETNPDIFSGIVRESQVRLFFLDEMNKQDWHTREFYSNVLIGMNKLVDEFIAQISKDSHFFMERATFERVNHSDFGLKIISNQGHIEALFADNLSGVELAFTLPVRDCCGCSNC